MTTECNTDAAPVAQPSGVAGRCYDVTANEEVTRCVPATARSVLDVGCGSGGNARQLATEGRVVDGVTLSAEEAIEAATNCREVAVHNLETGIPETMPGPYDVVICSHVLEHICFPVPLLTDIRRVLRPDGMFVVAVPNIFFYRTRLKLLLGRWEYERGGIMDETHFRWYTLASLKRLLIAQGFRVEREFGDGIFPSGPLRSIAPAISRALDKLACRCAPGLFAAQLVLVVRSPLTQIVGQEPP